MLIAGDEVGGRSRGCGRPVGATFDILVSKTRHE
jgi:hypothetical protein